MSFTRVNVTSDTPEWEQERRGSIGASEVAAVMGMSRYGTPLDVYKHKHGLDAPFDPVLAYMGHASEPVIEGWIRRFSGLNLDMRPGFMARSTERPHLHASFDRIVEEPFLTIQMKTAHQYLGHHWDEGIPDDIRVQIQAEMYVAGTSRALAVVWIGGREFRSFWEPRDERFIQEHMLPTVDAFWQRVQDGNPPEPSNVAEIQEVWPTDAEADIDLSETAFEVLERITVLRSDIKAQQAEEETLRVALAPYVKDATVLKYRGQKVATWKSQKGRTGFDREAFAADHPELMAQYTRQGEPFKVLRRTKQKETQA